MDKGAVENWLARTFVHARQSWPDIDWTFYCTLPSAGRLVDQLRSLGATVVTSPIPFGQTRAFLRAMRAYLKSSRFDVLHCHHDFLSGFYLWSALGLPIRQRWVHVHNTDEALPTPSRWKHRLLLEPLRQSCLRMSTGVIGISNHVLDQFLRGRPRREGCDVVRYYGVDTTSIHQAEHAPLKFRQELQLPADAVVLLFIGRLSPLKNPVFVVDILRATLDLRPNAYAVFVGEGDLADAVKGRARELQIADRIRLLGWRDDVPYLMKNCDCFVFPRPETPVEGLGLVVVESQACGLPTVTTPGISEDAILCDHLVKRIPLGSTPIKWAESLVAQLASRADSAISIEQSRFGMDISTNQLMALYVTRLMHVHD